MTESSFKSVKQEADPRQEKTKPGKYYLPATDIFETGDALMVVMEMPGVGRGDVDVNVEKNVLSVDGRIQLGQYGDLRPLYTEYNLGHYSRSFTLSNEIDQSGISAQMVDGVLTLRLPKARVATSRRIQVS